MTSVASAKEAPKESHGFIHRAADRAWSWVHATLPERQIYIRSDGRVQFFTFSTPLQATLAGLSLILLFWLAFTSVNVIFKDRIIAAKDHRYQTMQSNYETRVADLQLSYDELNGALVAAEDRFKATADEAEAKHDSLARLLGKKQAIDTTLSGIGNAALPAAKPGVHSIESAARAAKGMPSDSLTPVMPSAAPQAAPVQQQTGSVMQPTKDGSEIQISPMPAQPEPRTARPARASLFDLGAALYHLAVAPFAKRKRPVPAHIANQPQLRALAEQTARLEHVSASDDVLAVQAKSVFTERADRIQHVMRAAGINPASMQHRAEQASGGPLMSLNAVPLDGIADATFQSAYTSAALELSRLSALLSAFRHVPLAMPVQGQGFEETSDFGPRVDPFTGHGAFHAGIDFGGPYGSPVHSTAAGTVVWAGPKGPYGNMVEIDHGMGLHTRYGHLSAVLVSSGTQVAKGTQLGRLGSTGRSTGPHVHYEVWVDNRVRDPAPFLEAGHHVLQ